MTWVFAREERWSFSFVDVSAFFTPGVRMMGTTNSLSSERAKSAKQNRIAKTRRKPWSKTAQNREAAKRAKQQSREAA